MAAQDTTMPLPPKNWVPKTKAEEQMAIKYRGWAGPDRMREAVRQVQEDGLSQTQAAKRLGVSRSRLNQNVGAVRKKVADADARVAAARAEKVAVTNETVVPVMLGVPAGPERDVHLERLALPGDATQMIPDGPVGTQPPIFEDRRVGTFREFNERYFGNEICPDCGVHHETPGFHGEIMDLMSDRDRRLKLINLAPYHGKSSTATLKSTLYEIVRDPSSRTALISRAAPLAEAFLYQIKQHLVDTDLYTGAAGNLIDDWGPFYNANHWSNNQIYIAGRSGAQKEPTISVYGFGAQIYGRRFDRMIFDDVADLENSNTPEQVAKMYKKIWQEYVNRTGKTGQVAWIGTRVNPGDIYTLLEQVDGMNVLRFPCILEEEDQKMLWPEHFPYASAVQFRTAMTEAEFQLVYQNVDVPGMGASFTQETMDRSHDSERFIGQWDPSWAMMLGVDPAGAGAQSGYTAMVCMGVDLNTGRRHLVDVINQKAMKAPQMLAQIIEWSERYSPREARVEVNGLQSQLLQYNDELNQKLSNAGVRIVPHITHKGNKWDPQFGVEAMSTLYHNNMISTPWGDANSRKKFGALEQQLMQFPMGKVTDMVMAMWFASLSATEVFKRTQLPMFDTRHKVPGRIRRRRGVIDFGDSTVRAPTREEENSSLYPQAMALPAERFVNVPGDVNAGVGV